MENNKTNFERFAGLYIGQSMIVTKSNFYPIDAGRVFMINRGCWDYVMNQKLKFAVQLKPLADILDEDAIAVAKTIWGMEESKGYSTYQDFIEDVRCNVNSIVGKINNALTISLNFYEHLELIDFLRSRGYLIPFHNLSIEQILEYGWAKITPPTN